MDLKLLDQICQQYNLGKTALFLLKTHPITQWHRRTDIFYAGSHKIQPERQWMNLQNNQQEINDTPHWLNQDLKRRNVI